MFGKPGYLAVAGCPYLENRIGTCNLHGGSLLNFQNGIEECKDFREKISSFGELDQ